MSDKSLTILIVLMVIVLVGALIFREHWPDVEVQVTNSSAVEEVSPKRQPSLRAVMTDCGKVGEMTRIEGYVQNTGTVSLAHVTLQSLWKDGEGNIIGRGEIYAVGDENPLLPGEKRKFEDVTTRSGVERCNVQKLDWWS